MVLNFIDVGCDDLATSAPQCMESSHVAVGVVHKSIVTAACLSVVHVYGI